MNPRLSIVVVSYNTRDLLRRCLASVVNSPLYRVVPDCEERDAQAEQFLEAADGSPLFCELIVVDNDSTDGSAEIVESEFPEVTLVRAGSNLGFARATNVGLARSHGDLLLLLNPDTEVLGDSLARLADFMDGHPGVGCVGPSLVYPDGRPQHAAFRFPTLAMSFLDLFPLHHRLTESRLNGRYPGPIDREPFPIDHPLGAAMMIRRDALSRVGALDEDFFIYCEEVDWCVRARKAGFGIYQVPTAKIVHHSGQSTGQFREAMLVELHRSRYRLFRKHYSRWFVFIHRLITRAWAMKETTAATRLAARGLIDTEEMQARLRAYRTIGAM